MAYVKFQSGVEIVAMSGSGLKTLSYFLLVALVLYAAASGSL